MLQIPRPPTVDGALVASIGLSPAQRRLHFAIQQYPRVPQTHAFEMTSLFLELDGRDDILDVVKDQVKVLEPTSRQSASGARGLCGRSCLVLMGTAPGSAIISANLDSSEPYTCTPGIDAGVVQDYAPNLGGDEHYRFAECSPLVGPSWAREKDVFNGLIPPAASATRAFSQAFREKGLVQPAVSGSRLYEYCRLV